MGVYSWRELPRSATHKLGDSPEYVRTFTFTLDNPDTSAAECVAACGAYHASSHPELIFALCYDLAHEEAYEGNRYWSKLVAKYRVPRAEEKNANLLPWQRPDRWKFQSKGSAVPALFYYDGTTQKPLVNSAGDYFEGLMTDESQQVITITSNRQTFPSAMAAAITNCLNDSTYAGFAQDCIKVDGITGEEVSETIDGQEYSYYKITSVLIGKQTGWPLLIPDIGWNYIDGGVRRRATVTGPDGDLLPSTNPVPLDGAGGIKAPGSLPEILTRRTQKRITMGTYFGTPPT